MKTFLQMKSKFKNINSIKIYKIILRKLLKALNCLFLKHFEFLKIFIFSSLSKVLAISEFKDLQ